MKRFLVSCLLILCSGGGCGRRDEAETLPYKYVSVEGLSSRSKRRIVSAIGVPSRAVISAPK